MNITILIISFILTEAYTIYIKRKYGIQKSISFSASLIQDKEKRSPLFFIWVLLLAFSLAYIANNPLCYIGAVILTLIGGFTGFNPKFWKSQNTIHTTAVLIAIVLFEIGIVQINHYVALLTLIPALLVVVNIFTVRPPEWIWYSEKVVIYHIYLSLLIINL